MASISTIASEVQYGCHSSWQYTHFRQEEGKSRKGQKSSTGSATQWLLPTQMERRRDTDSESKLLDENPVSAIHRCEVLGSQLTWASWLISATNLPSENENNNSSYIDIGVRNKWDNMLGKFPAQSKCSWVGWCDYVSFNKPRGKGGQNTDFYKFYVDH